MVLELSTKALCSFEVKIPTDQTELITAEVQELKSKGAISLVRDNTQGFHIPDFYCPQKIEDIGQ